MRPDRPADILWQQGIWENEWDGSRMLASECGAQSDNKTLPSCISQLCHSIKTELTEVKGSLFWLILLEVQVLYWGFHLFGPLARAVQHGAANCFNHEPGSRKEEETWCFLRGCKQWWKDLPKGQILTIMTPQLPASQWPDLDTDFREDSSFKLYYLSLFL